MRTNTVKHRFQLNAPVQANFFNGEVKARFVSENGQPMYVVKEIAKVQRVGKPNVQKTRVFSEKTLRGITISHD